MDFPLEDEVEAGKGCVWVEEPREPNVKLGKALVAGAGEGGLKVKVAPSLGRGAAVPYWRMSITLSTRRRRCKKIIRTREGKGFKEGRGAVFGAAVAEAGSGDPSGAGLALEAKPRRFGSGFIFRRANSFSLAFFHGAG